MKSKKIILISILILQASAILADETADQIRELRQQIEALDQKVKLLEQKSREEHDAAEIRRKDLPTITAGADGFSMRSADTNFVLRILGYGQVDSRFYFDDAPARDTFLIRRLRLGLEGSFFKYYDYKVLTDFGSGINSTAQNDNFLQDAFLNIHYTPKFQVQFGKFKEPVSLELLQSDSKLLFVERGLPTLLAPNRDVGIMVHGELFDDRLNYALGIFNGVTDGGSDDVETSNSGKEFAGRVFAHPFKSAENKLLHDLAFGIGGSYGDRGEELPGYVTTGRQRFFTYRTGLGTNAATRSVASDGVHWRIAPQGYYYFGPFGIYGEYAISSQEAAIREGAPSKKLDVENDAWNVAVSYVLTGEQNSFNRIVPQHPLTLGGEGWGAWEIAARFGELSIDHAAYPLVATANSARKITAWEIGLNWYLNRNVKFNFDYSQTHFEGGNNAAGSVTAEDEKVFLGRTQFSF